MDRIYWKRAGFGATLVLAPFAYNLAMAYWASVYLGFVNLPTNPSMATIVSQMGAANFVGIAVLAVAFAYLVSFAYPRSLVVMTFVVGVVIVSFNEAVHLLVISRELPNPITLTEWVTVLVVFPLAAKLVKAALAKREVQQNA